ncbi:MAG: NADH:ubiquinone oxidoreductase [Rhodobacter sp.]|nr:NADH:ubiquinone oxidoreductase [Rhodobacter sp.]
MIAENKQTPLLAGWVIAAAVGLVAAAVSYVVVGLSPLQCCFVGALIFAVVGLILGLPGRVQVASGEPVDTALRPVNPQPLAAAAPLHAPAPAAAPSATPLAPRRPAGLTGARSGAADDLKRIKGVGPKLEQLCHSLGFYHFDQIAAWTADEIAWVDENLEGFKGRVTRDDWVAQARILAAGGTTEFSDRVDKGDVY